MVGREPGFRGWWADHKLFKPSVFRDVNRWEGWDYIIDLVNTMPTERDKDLLTVLFETGARAAEAVQYRVENFIDEGDKILVTQAPLVKNKELGMRWDFYIEKSEPLVPRLMALIERIGSGYLFPSRLGNKPHLSRQYLWHTVKTNLNLYPHWFRAQRAFCLTWFHNLDFEELRAWFTWLDPNTPQHYTRPSPIKIAKKFRKFVSRDRPSGGDNATQSEASAP